MATEAQAAAETEESTNQPPPPPMPANESIENPIEFMLNRTLDEEAKEVMSRIVEKQKQKAEELL